jgi:hypothetical protein
MLTLMLSTMILALTFGGFWHNQPARRQKDEREAQAASRLGGVVNRALKWLLLMPHVSNPVAREGVFLAKGVLPARQTEFFRPVLRALLSLNPRRRTLVDRSAVEPSIPADLFKAEANTDALATGRAA